MDFDTLVIIHKIANVLTVPVSLLVAALYAPKYGYQRSSALKFAGVVLVIVVLFSYAFYYVMWWFGIEAGLNSYRTFLLLPLITYTASEEWEIPALQGADFVIPALFIVRAMVLIACNLVGCSMAVPCDWGMYSTRLGHRVFPMDLIDLISTALLAIFSFCYAKKLNYQGNGRVFAMCMCLLGAVRFFLQFGSTEVWWVRGFNDETLYSLISMITGIVIFNRYQMKQKTSK